MLALIYLNADTIWRNFLTNVPINTVIFTIIFSALFYVFYNNRKLRETVRFLMRIEDVEDQENISREDIELLQKSLRKEGALLDIVNMQNVIDRMDDHGFALFTDMDARLIKSKFGYRVRNDRQIVSYFAGILVMLGLIGTFWGLLITIDSVGSAMTMVSESFNSGDQDISKFLSSISTPLSGMGLAFSSSLFGLSGSLFLGFLNFFGGKTQNQVIEVFSRWADEHIPSMNNALRRKVAKTDTPPGDDLQTWLAGFVYLSTKMNKQIQSLTYAVGKSAQASYINTQHIDKALNQQNDYNDKLNEIIGSVDNVAQKIQQVSVTENEKNAVIENSRLTMENISALLRKMNTESQDNQKNQVAIQSEVKNMKQEFGLIFDDIQNCVNDMNAMVKSPQDNFDVYDVMRAKQKPDQSE